MAVYWKVKPGRKTPDFKNYLAPRPGPHTLYPILMAKEPGTRSHPRSKAGPTAEGASSRHGAPAPAGAPHPALDVALDPPPPRRPRRRHNRMQGIPNLQ